jgi:MSHA biogenesis protein MshJ
MKAQWSALMAKFDALALRERRLIAVAVLGGVLLVGWAMFIDPAFSRIRMAQRGIVEQRAQLSELQAQTAILQSPAQDPDSRARAELAALKLQLNRLNERLSTMESSLVPPQRMTGLLEEILGRRSGLHLLSLHTVSVKPLLEKSEGAESASTAKKSADGLYKHGVEIKLEGSYSELADYLARLEKSPQKLLWSSASLSADKHPRLVLTLTVFTLSLDKTWLTV